MTAKTAQELLAAATKAGVAITPELTQNIDNTATAYANASVAAQMLAKSQDEIKQQALELRDFGKDALHGFIDDLEQGKTAGEALVDVLKKVASKLEDITLDALFGGGDSGSTFGLIGKALGFADGGVMTSSGPRQLQRYAGGGVSHKAAIFGEAGPEAAVPLPDGRRIPVDLRGAGARPASMNHHYNVTVKVDGARGSQEIQDAARQGANAALAQNRLEMRQAFAQYDKGLTANLQRRQLTGR